MKRLTPALFLLALLVAGAVAQECAGTSSLSVNRRRTPRHFSNPELTLQVQPPGTYVVTNIYQEPLTAFVLKIEDPAMHTQTLIFDAYTLEMITNAVPQGLSVVNVIPHVEGKPATTNVSVVAAVWDDGSTYGRVEILNEIDSQRTVVADAFDRALKMLQEGLEKKWVAAQFIDSARTQQKEFLREGGGAAAGPFVAISRNVKELGAERAAKALIRLFTTRRDRLRESLATRN
jgi:hypothetical protein